MSFRVTVPCTRAHGEAITESDDLLPRAVLVADQPNESKPDEWLIRAYFEEAPSTEDLAALRAVGTGEPFTEELGEADWVTMSQAGLQPIRAGRFFVRTPTFGGTIPEGTVPFEIDASLAFGTGQHATTSGCLEALDRLERQGKCFTRIADIGTGTGLLAFAALALWPDARCIATDVDARAISVARDNAAINGVKLGHGTGELLLAVADGMNSPLLVARAPYELLIANILAGPLIELMPAFARATVRGGNIILAGLLDSQAPEVARAVEDHGLALVERGIGEWPVLICEQPA